MRHAHLDQRASVNQKVANCDEVELVMVAVASSSAFDDLKPRRHKTAECPLSVQSGHSAPDAEAPARYAPDTSNYTNIRKIDSRTSPSE